MQDHMKNKILYCLNCSRSRKSMSRSDDDRSLSHASGAAKDYGTVTTRVSPGYVEHAVQATDTLQGIALKYGTTVSPTL